MIFNDNEDDEMIHLCDRVDGWSHLSVPLTRSHLNRQRRPIENMEICGRQDLFVSISNLPEERHVGFNCWLTAFVDSAITGWLDDFQCCWIWLHRCWSKFEQLVASMLEKLDRLWLSAFSRYCLRMLTINQPDNQDIKIITSGGAVLCSKPPKTLLIRAAFYFCQRIKNVFSDFF